MKIDTLIIIAAAGAGLYFMSRTLKTTVSNAIPIPRPTGGGTASSLNNGGNLPMTNGGGFSNLPSYLVFDPNPYLDFPMTNGGGFSNLPTYLVR